MSVENKEIGKNNLPNIKELLKNNNIDQALSGLGNVSNETVNNRAEELRGSYQLAEFTKTLSDDDTNGINNILSQFLSPQHLAV